MLMDRYLINYSYLIFIKGGIQLNYVNLSCKYQKYYCWLCRKFYMYVIVFICSIESRMQVKPLSSHYYKFKTQLDCHPNFSNFRMGSLFYSIKQTSAAILLTNDLLQKQQHVKNNPAYTTPWFRGIYHCIVELKTKEQL